VIDGTVVEATEEQLSTVAPKATERKAVVPLPSAERSVTAPTAVDRRAVVRSLPTKAYVFRPSRAQTLVHRSEIFFRARRALAKKVE
jgi:hypothetical protein